MFPEIDHLSQKIWPQHSLNVMIGLTVDESRLLAELQEAAKAIAPVFSQALTTRLLQFSSSERGYIGNVDLHACLQNWFVQLFQMDRNFQLYRESPPLVPINWLLTGIDMILFCGHEVSQSSPKPELAAKAFYKSLALKIASDQQQFQMDDAQHFLELILLD